MKESTPPTPHPVIASEPMRLRVWPGPVVMTFIAGTHLALVVLVRFLTPGTTHSLGFRGDMLIVSETQFWISLLLLFVSFCCVVGFGFAGSESQFRRSLAWLTMSLAAWVWPG